jgi:anion-transporting  ArsA/GET3 family ATPase
MASERANHELVVIDMPATGHTLALTGLPEILLKLMPRGPVARALKEGQTYLNDPVRGEAWVVTLPEKLPVTEGIELVDGLRETGVSPGGFILNRVPKNPFTELELETLEKLVPQARFHGELALDRIRSATASLDRLIEETQLPVVELPQGGNSPIDTLTECLQKQMVSS